MYLFVYVCIYVYMYVCMNVRMHVSMYVCLCVLMYVSMYPSRNITKAQCDSARDMATKYSPDTVFSKNTAFIIMYLCQYIQPLY